MRKQIEEKKNALETLCLISLLTKLAVFVFDELTLSYLEGFNHLHVFSTVTKFIIFVVGNLVCWLLIAEYQLSIMMQQFYIATFS